jgi:hypothetical protein
MSFKHPKCRAFSLAIECLVGGSLALGLVGFILFTAWMAVMS